MRVSLLSLTPTSPPPEYSPLSLHDALPIWKIVQPGYGPTTRFGSNTGARMEGTMPAAYAPYLAQIMRGLGQSPDRKSTRLNSSHEWISYAVFCLKKKKKRKQKTNSKKLN